MNRNHSTGAKTPIKTLAAAPSRLEGWIEDPMASAFLATGLTAVAITCVLTGMWVVSLLLG